MNGRVSIGEFDQEELIQLKKWASKNYITVHLENSDYSMTNQIPYMSSESWKKLREDKPEFFQKSKSE